MFRDERLNGRIEGWRSVLAPAGLTPIALDLARGETRALAERLEGGLIEGASLR